MANYNSSNAYEVRYEENAAEKIRKPRPAQPARPTHTQKKHIKPNMTVRLNRKRESKPVLAPKPLVRTFKSFDAGQVRLLFAAGFAFCVLMMFFGFTIGCQVKDNEMTHMINEKKNVLSNLQNDYTGLVLKREKILNDAYVEEYAEQNLGMKKRENRQVNWIEVDWDSDFDD